MPPLVDAIPAIGGKRPFPLSSTRAETEINEAIDSAALGSRTNLIMVASESAVESSV
jgi:hypothetical protein